MKVCAKINIFIVLLISGFYSFSQDYKQILPFISNDTILEYTFESSDLDFHLFNDYLFCDLNHSNSFLQIPSHPQLPTLSFSFYSRPNSNFSYEIIEDVADTILVPSEFLHYFIIPAPLNTSKSSLPYYLIDSNIYFSSNYYSNGLFTISSKGTFRDYLMNNVIISPIEYSPLRNSLILHSKIKISLHLSHSKPNQNYTFSPDFSSHSLLIVCPSDFVPHLDDFISWKQQKGIEVSVISFSLPDRDSIKAAIDDYFLNSSFVSPMPSYILLVGDYQQLPPFWSRHLPSGFNVHVTDTYYGDFTGDCLPESFVGRISVQDTLQLKEVITKLLMYEQYSFPDDSFLNKSLIVAGREFNDQATIFTNGQVNYLSSRYLSSDFGMDTICYRNPYSAEHVNDIFHNISDGVGFINYSGHCLASGWRNPTIGIPQLDSLPQNDELFFIVNNCCSSNAFSSDCFGEELLRKPHGGAIGVIGATNETFWNEDYIWAVGAQQASLFPEYSINHLGAFDRLFHSHDEPESLKAKTMGEILFAGDMAVTQSGSIYYNFYWETYCLLGDPSLMPYVGIPHPIVLVHEDSLEAYSMSIQVSGTPGCLVAAMADSVLLGRGEIDSSGTALIPFKEPFNSSKLLLTATGQYLKPRVDTVYSTPCSQAKIIPVEVLFRDSLGNGYERIPLGEELLMEVRLKNVGGLMAHNHYFMIDTLSIPLSLDVNQDTVVYASFMLDTLPHRKIAHWELSSWDDAWVKYHSRSVQALVNASEIVPAEFAFLQEGESFDTLLKDESYQIKVILTNRGTTSSRSLKVKIRSEALMPQDTSWSFPNVLPSDTLELSFSAQVSSESKWLDVDLDIDSDGKITHYDFRYAISCSESDIREPEKERLCYVYPNPARDRVFIHTGMPESKLEIYDMRGVKLDEFFIKDAGLIQYSTYNLRLGVYVIVITSEEGVESFKLLINK